MVHSGIYIVNVTGDGIKSEKLDTSAVKEDKTYEYEEAINLTGNGCYSCGLLAVLSLALLGMAVEIFGFSVIVTGSACDFQLEHWQRSVMLSMPFIGAVLMGLAWGYVSDTQGRRKLLLIALWGGFICSFISAFSAHWIMLAVLKFLSCTFCSAVQSGAYALLSESTASSVRGIYMLIMTSAMMLFVLSYIVPAYFILQLPFAYNIGVLVFTPWRLLALVLAAPLGISAILLNFYYESPKFLVNVGREELALEYLAKIWARNGRKDEYPVHKVVLNESRSFKKEDHILKSLWLQTVPMFKPTLLWTSLRLFYLAAVIYSVNNSLVMWMPYIIDAFTTGSSSSTDEGSRSLCSILKSVNVSHTGDSTTCSSSIQTHTLLSGVTHGLVFAGITLLMSRLASRKKLLLILFLLIPALSSLGAVFNENNLASLVLFVGMLMTNLCMGIHFSYFVELYPTSYSFIEDRRGGISTSGMAACLGVLVARISGLAGVNLLGSYIMSHCTITVSILVAYLMSGVAVAMFLPPDIKSKEV